MIADVNVCGCMCVSLSVCLSVSAVFLTSAVCAVFCHICLYLCVSLSMSVCLSLCCPVCALTFEGIDLETLFLVCRHIFSISRRTKTNYRVKSTTKYTHLWAVYI